jgi:hypothetical protein
MTVDVEDSSVGAQADLDSVPLVPNQGEDESDFADSSVGFKASIGGKDWTVETLVSQMRKGRIDLDPSFQRRNAWLANRKSKLIESIMLGFPVPQIVLAEKRDKPGHYFVLDGKQRLLALRQFFVDPSDDRDSGFESLKLSGLEVLAEHNRKNATQLDESAPELYAQTENHSIRTVVLSNWNSERLLLSLFLRLNTGSVALSPQELRQALINGQFINWLDAESGQLPALRSLLNNSNPDRRMVDAELTLRHLSFSLSPYDYKGNLKDFLDNSSRYFNDNWGTIETDANGALAEFSLALEAGESIFGAGVFCRKWSQSEPSDTGNAGQVVGKYERALNRAVFDVQAYSLSLAPVRQAMVPHGEAILAEYRNRCATDENFVRAISATTKTADAFITRHRVWSSIVKNHTGVDYELPQPLRRP